MSLRNTAISAKYILIDLCEYLEGEIGVEFKLSFDWLARIAGTPAAHVLSRRHHQTFL